MGIQTYWYQKSFHPLLLPLLPFALVFGLIIYLRRWAYRYKLIKSQRFSIPVIVIGNITIGGTGKTPFVLWLANYLKKQGKNPGIALRGTGGKKQNQPSLVTANADPFELGDEAVLLAKNTDCPVVVCTDRPAAVRTLAELSCDLVLCDDGLQHYRLARTLEIALIDDSRYFGNGLLLPAGPLREPLSRLKEVDLIVINEHGSAQQAPTPLDKLQDIKDSKKKHKLQLRPKIFISVHHPAQVLELSNFSGKKVHAVAGLGNPQRFFDLLSSLNIKLIPHIFPDHHRYQSNDLDFSDDLPILMTEKDAVKCMTLPFNESAKGKQWFLELETEVSLGLKEALKSLY